MLGKSESLVNVSGEATKIAQIEATGVKLPMEIITSNELELMIRTGIEGKSGNFPATVIYKKGTSTQKSNGKEESVSSPISGMVVRGTYKTDNSFTVDTILSDKIDEGSKEMMRSSLEGVSNQVNFPSTPMAIGDNFKHSIPISLPALSGLAAVNFPISTVYTLTEIGNEKILFDITQTVNVDSLINGNYVSAIGSGSGQAIYDVEDRFITKYEYDLSIGIKLTVNDLLVESDTKIISRQDVEIK
jgi:hypothetical protein